jgi:hypothetical protein
MLGEVAGGRLEVLTAANETAYDGCFTRTLLRVLEEGIPSAGDYLHPAAVVSRLAAGCTAQVPVQLSYNSGQLNLPGVFDEGLWLVPNPVRVRHALTGRPDAGRIDQLLRGVTLSPAQRSVLFDLEDQRGKRLRIIQGPAGSGKSTISAALIAPPVGLELSVRVAAAVFLDNTSTPEAVAMELSAQLSVTVPGFANAVALVASRVQSGELPAKDLDSMDRLVVLPATATLTPDQAPVEVIFDAVDQAPTRSRDLITHAIARIAYADGLGKMRVIVTIRTGSALPPDLQDGVMFQVAPPTWSEVKVATGRTGAQDSFIGAVDEGGWLAARLLNSVDPGARAEGLTLAELTNTLIDAAADRLGDHAEELDRVLRVLSVSGLGPALPLDVLVPAVHELGGTADPPTIRTVLGTLTPLVQSSRAGEPEEHVGLSHARVAANVSDRVTTAGADGAIADALATLYTNSDQPPSPWVSRYASEAWAIR